MDRILAGDVENVRHEAYMKQRIAEEDAKLGINVEYNNLRLTKEVDQILQRLEIIEEKIDELIKKRG